MNALVRANIELLFPGLRNTSWAVKSRRTKGYNCIAWAAREKNRRWDIVPLKGCYWPKAVKRKAGIAYLVAAYAAHGFEACPKQEGCIFDHAYDKIVLYERNAEWTHAARLLEGGKWTSKLGNIQDIIHPTPESLICTTYGEPMVYMKRKRNVRRKHP